jgi:hypothetical protein
MSGCECHACAAGKMHCLPFPDTPLCASALGDLIHSDLLNVSHASLGGNRYILTFIDDHSRKLFVCLLQRKSDAFARFWEFHALLERQTECKLKVLCTDNSGEYVSHIFSTPGHSGERQCRHLHTSKTAAHTGPSVATSQSISGQARCHTSRTFMSLAATHTSSF